MTFTVVTVVGLAATIAALTAAFSFRYAWWRPAVDDRHPRILMYHMIRPRRPGARFNKLRVAPEQFEQQLRFLSGNGWRFAFLSELADLAGTPKTVVLTFDDGYRDNYLAAHPLLVKYGAKATLFLVVDRFDRDWSTAKKAHHDSGELMREEKLGDAELRAMLDSGVWELGAHTLTHALLPDLPDRERHREVANAKAAIETQFDTEVTAFAYPFGIYTDDDVATADQAGYRFAVTTDAGISTDIEAEALRLKRIKISGKEGRLGFFTRLRTGRRGLVE